ncbi:formate transporter FocA [Psychromonas sp. Urea-02u-13]|uniref:formate transporter FocA n=1 Tax=Psychromonas sp. Urea-02u-13 TaxID=2058326 RepID=UPI000C328B84|nr:formate transporter FocA [Psychromonas sp. Urea-02u-13]PKG39955.1 formate transporter FocA [Psychromonas sp. Urea-02u-13]
MHPNSLYSVKNVAQDNNQANSLVVDNLFDTAKQYGVSKCEKSLTNSFILAIFAGTFIAIAFVFYTTVTTGASDVPWGMSKLVGGLAFSLGLVLVVVCGGELFTSTVLSCIAWTQGLCSTKALLSCWSRVYLGNLVGALLVVGLVLLAKMELLNGGAWGINAMQIAQHKLHHSWGQAFALGVLCNLLVCLGIWMTFTSKDMLTKAVLLILPVAMFVSSGFEHSIANLFMVPLGIAINAFSSASFLEAHGFGANAFADLTWSNFIFHNLIPVTIGNIVGGASLIALAYANKPKHTTNTLNNALTTQTLSTQVNNQTQGNTQMKNKLNKLIVSDIMQPQTLLFSADSCIYQALAVLSEQTLSAAPVVNDKEQLIGFVSEQDILRLLWSEEYSADLNYQLKDVMQTEILTVDASQAITTLLEFMVVDKEKLFPVNQSGMLMSSQYQSYDQRLKAASANRPSIYPVIHEGKICGIITRKQLAQLMAKQYQPEDKQEKKVA